MSQRFIRDYLVLLTGGILLQIGELLYRLVLAGQAGAETLGLTGMVFPLYRFLCILSTLGLCPTLTRMAAVHQGNALAVEATYHRLILRFAVLLSLALVLAAPLLSRYVYPDPRVLPLFYLMATALPLTALAIAYQSSLQGHGYPGSLIMAEWVELAVEAGFVLAAVFNRSFSPAGAAQNLLIGFVLAEAASLFYLHRSWQAFREQATRQSTQPPVTAKIGRSIRSSLLILLNQFLLTASSMAEGWLIPQRLLVSGLSATAATRAVGQLWGMIYPVVFLPATLMTPLAPLVLPRSARWSRMDDWSQIRPLLIRLLWAAGFLGVCSAVFVSRAARTITALLYPGASIADEVRRWAAVLPFAFTGFPAVIVLQGLGKYRTLAGITLLTVIVRTALVFLLTGDPSLRLHGTRFAVIFSQALATILFLAAIIAYLHRKQRQEGP